MVEPNLAKRLRLGVRLAPTVGGRVTPWQNFVVFDLDSGAVLPVSRVAVVGEDRERGRGGLVEVELRLPCALDIHAASLWPDPTPADDVPDEAGTRVVESSDVIIGIVGGK